MSQPKRDLPLKTIALCPSYSAYLSPRLPCWP